MMVVGRVTTIHWSWTTTLKNVIELNLGLGANIFCEIHENKSNGLHNLKKNYQCNLSLK